MNLRITTGVLIAVAICGTASAKLPTAQETRRAIEKVNTQWQKNNPPECRAFWDNAAYHTGNMEAYKLTGNPEFLNYSKNGPNITNGKVPREATRVNGNMPHTARTSTM